MTAPVKTAAILTPETPLVAVRGIGPERAAQLARLKCLAVRDLLLHRPRRYEDRRHFLPIRDLALDTAATVQGQITACGTKYYRNRAQSVFEIILEDGTGRLHCRWWNLPFMQHYFKAGDIVMVYGKPVSLKPRTIDHPETEVIETGEEDFIHLNRIVPVYPLTDGLPQRWLRALIWRLIQEPSILWPEPHPGLNLAEYPSRQDAIRQLHFPKESSDAERARERLALDEFIDLQAAIQKRRRKLLANAPSLPCAGNNRLIKPWLAGLGFALTQAQTRVLRELRQDMGSQHPMRRLLQGDVGSGKTVVAGGCALMTLESGFSAAIMAPTEILAAQHYRTFRQWFEPLGIPVSLHTGSHKESAKAEHGTTPGSPPSSSGRGGGCPAGQHGPRLVIGTHALIESGFELENLGLVIIDEQHKFGVVQREKLVRKGCYPHLLVMTATPIPRTLGLTLYGDLDVSVLDQGPGGRGRVRTFVRTVERLPKVWEFVKNKLTEGRQAYIVYPLVEESDQAGLKAVTSEFEHVQATLSPHAVGLLHGRMRDEDKERVMTEFRAGRLAALLATTIIEVGVDVANATVMVIENAERFGLAQLHQLRGRIGRGAHEAFCILIAEAKTGESRERLRIMEETTDGFRIAEADLALRGPGELLGQQQSGLPPFRFGDLTKDLKIIEKARQLATERLTDGETASGLSKTDSTPPQNQARVLLKQ